MNDDIIHMYTDGACSGNPGPAGSGVYIQYNSHEKEISKYLGEATNNIAELQAIKLGLEALTDTTKETIIYSDSAYCIGLLTKNWNPKANIELVKELRSLVVKFNNLTFVKVKGHNGNYGNEKADELAVRAVRQRG